MPPAGTPAAASTDWISRSVSDAARALGVRTYPTHTYFFLADLASHNAAEIAEQLRHRDILIKPLNDPALGPGFMRITTALPEDNRRFVDALRALLT